MQLGEIEDIIDGCFLQSLLLLETDPFQSHLINALILVDDRSLDVNFMLGWRDVARLCKYVTHRFYLVAD